MKPEHPTAHRLGSDGYLSLVALAASAYGAIFSYLTILQHQTLNSTAFDLGIFDQVIWNTAHGRWFETSYYGPCGFYSFLGEHFSPLLALLAPVYWVWDDVRTLLIFQSFWLALGAFPIYLLARDRLGQRPLGLLFALLYLTYPGLGYLNMFDFHEIALAVPLLALAFYFLETERWRFFGLAALLSLGVKEEVALVVATMGLYLAVFKGRKGAGLAVAGVALAYFVFSVHVAIPYFSEGQGFRFFRDRYGYLGGSLAEVLHTSATRPAFTAWECLRRIFGFKKLVYLLMLTMPLGLTPFAAPRVLLLAALPFAWNVSADFAAQADVRYQYEAVMVPFLAAAALFGAASLLKRGWPRRLLFGWLLACALTGVVLQVVRPLRAHPLTPPPNTAQFHEAASLIPPEAALMADNSFAPQLSHRRHIEDASGFQARSIARLPEYVILDIANPRWLGPSEHFVPPLRRLIERGWGTLYYRNGVLLLKRGAPARPELEASLMSDLAALSPAQ